MMITEMKMKRPLKYPYSPNAQSTPLAIHQRDVAFPESTARIVVQQASTANSDAFMLSQAVREKWRNHQLLASSAPAASAGIAPIASRAST